MITRKCFCDICKKEFFDTHFGLEPEDDSLTLQGETSLSISMFAEHTFPNRQEMDVCIVCRNKLQEVLKDAITEMMTPT